MTREEIRSAVNEIRAQNVQLATKLKEIQDECKHPERRVAGSITGITWTACADCDDIVTPFSSKESS